MQFVAAPRAHVVLLTPGHYHTPVLAADKQCCGWACIRRTQQQEKLIINLEIYEVDPVQANTIVNVRCRLWLC